MMSFCRYIFMCREWLAVEEGDGQIDRMIPVAGREDVTMFRALFTHGHAEEAHRFAPVDLRAVAAQPQSIHACTKGVLHPVSALHVHDRKRHVLQVRIHLAIWKTALKREIRSEKMKDSFYYRLGTVKSKSFVGKVLLRIKWKFELHYTL